jgi:hypothetical protein
MYGRLDPHSYFPTTVTNVDPTAKQSKVLNPYVRLYNLTRLYSVFNLVNVVQTYGDCSGIGPVSRFR